MVYAACLVTIVPEGTECVLRGLVNASIHAGPLLPYDRCFACSAGWVVLNLGMAHKQLELLGHVTTAMLLVNLFQVPCDLLEAEHGHCLSIQSGRLGSAV